MTGASQALSPGSIPGCRMFIFFHSNLMRSDHLIIILLLLFFFIIPIEFFVLGDGYGYGVKGFTYQYQVTTQGVSLIPITYEMDYILNGTITGKTATSILLWITGVIIYLIGMAVFLLTYDLKKRVFNRICTFFIFSSVLLVIFSSMLQYGIFFSGPAGISVLIGLPLLIGLSWYLVYNGRSIN
jgi:hypothetical protein